MMTIFEQNFADAFARLPHKHKVVIAGNHELSFDPECVHYKRMHSKTSLEDELKKCKFRW
jgi:hypothetical protein